jgi:hypothetical protein
MIRAPNLAAIQAAELRVARAWRLTHESLHRVPVAVRATLTRPSTVMLAAGLAGVVGLCIARRWRAKSSPNASRPAASPSAAKVVAAFLARFGMQYLGVLIRQVWAARDHTAGRGVDASAKSPATATSLHGSRT